jgi:hypothetical protein
MPRPVSLQIRNKELMRVADDYVGDAPAAIDHQPDLAANPTAQLTEASPKLWRNRHFRRDTTVIERLQRFALIVF